MPENTITKPPEFGEKRPVAHREDVVVAVLLSVAALASSWCGYQAARWSGISAMHYNESISFRAESIGAAGTANQLAAVDVDLFTNWLDAWARNDRMLADFYRERFRDEFKPAFDAWLDTEPLRNPQASPTPFQLPQYRLADRERATGLSRESDRLFGLALQANQQSDDYVLNSVALSSVLFLGGIASNFDRRAVRRGLTIIATVLLLGGLYNILVSPTV